MRKTAMTPTRIIKVTCGHIGFAVMVLFSAIVSVADDKDADKETAAKNLDWMKQYVQETKVTVLGKAERKAELQTHAVLRYDDQVRRIPDGTMWVWTSNSRPVAFQKVELSLVVKSWTVCFTSLADEPVEVEWRDQRSYRTRGTIAFREIPKAEPPADKAAARKFQLRSLARRFNARTLFNGSADNTAEQRLLPKPIFEYADHESKLPLGALFGMSGSGSNPEILLLIEARQANGGDLRWEFAPVRVTADGVILKIDAQEVWSVPAQRPEPQGFETWTYFFLRDTENLPAE